AVIRLVASNDRRLPGPVHAHDVDPMGGVGEKFRQRFHVMAIPGIAIPMNHVLDRSFVQVCRRRTADARCVTRHVRPPLSGNDSARLSPDGWPSIVETRHYIQDLLLPAMRRMSAAGLSPAKRSKSRIICI